LLPAISPDTRHLKNVGAFFELELPFVAFVDSELVESDMVHGAWIR
jgi:hypothetical protein